MHCEKKQLIIWPFTHCNTTKLPAEWCSSGISDHALIVTNSGEYTVPGLVAGKALRKTGFFLSWLCFGLNSKLKKPKTTQNELLKPNTFSCYTHSVVLLVFSKRPCFLNMKFSVWVDLKHYRGFYESHMFNLCLAFSDFQSQLKFSGR